MTERSSRRASGVAGRLLRAQFLRTIVGHLPEGQFGDWVRRRFWTARLGQAPLEYVGYGADLDFNLVIGTGIQIGKYVHVVASRGLPVYIGSDVLLAHGTYVRSANHRFDRTDTPIKHQGHTSIPVTYRGSEYAIVIEDDVWVGAYAVILPGAHVGRGSVISAHSVVSGSLPPFSIVAGNPARPIAKRKARVGGTH